jgi:hypothetical protein
MPVQTHRKAIRNLALHFNDRRSHAHRFHRVGRIRADAIGALLAVLKRCGAILSTPTET